MMDRFQREALDRHITGNYGEDQFKGCEEDRTMTHGEMAKELRAIYDEVSGLHLDDEDELRDKWHAADALTAVIAALESEPLAEIVAQYGQDAKGQHYLVFGPEVTKPNIYEYHGDPPMFPVTITVTKR